MQSDEPKLGQAQEARVRSRLSGLGYTQPYGATDEEIRRNLGFAGKCADFVGYHPERDAWLVAESKGNDIQGALEQIEVTLNALLASQPEAASKVDLQIYTNPAQYRRLREDHRGVAGYRLKNDFLGYRPGTIFIYSTIRGMRIQVFQES